MENTNEINANKWVKNYGDKCEYIIPSIRLLSIINKSFYNSLF